MVCNNFLFFVFQSDLFKALESSVETAVSVYKTFFYHNAAEPTLHRFYYLNIGYTDRISLKCHVFSVKNIPCIETQCA